MLPLIFIAICFLFFFWLW